MGYRYLKIQLERVPSENGLFISHCNYNDCPGDGASMLCLFQYPEANLRTQPRGHRASCSPKTGPSVSPVSLFKNFHRVSHAANGSRRIKGKAMAKRGPGPGQRNLMEVFLNPEIYSVSQSSFPEPSYWQNGKAFGKVKAVMCLFGSDFLFAYCHPHVAKNYGSSIDWLARQLSTLAC